MRFDERVGLFTKMKMCKLMVGVLFNFTSWGFIAWLCTLIAEVIFVNSYGWLLGVEFGVFCPWVDIHYVVIF